MSPARIATLPAAGLGLAALTLLPLYADAYYLALAIGLLQFTVLATAWGLFSGPTPEFGVVGSRRHRGISWSGSRCLRSRIFPLPMASIAH